jgi:hypothetical protein
MAALITRRSTQRHSGGGPERVFEVAMAASTTIHQGALVGQNASGLLVPMTAATGLRAIGRAEQSLTSGVGQNPRMRVSTGVFGWSNDAGDLVTSAARGAVCYASDDQTVSITSTGKSVAGVVIDLDGTTVWVNVGAEQK